MEDAEYIAFIVYGIKELYICTSRPNEYSESKLTVAALDTPQATATYNAVFSIDEQEFIILSALMEFLRKIQMMVNARMGYTTDAFSVTNADKPYVNIADTLRELKRERDIIHFKFANSM